MASLGETVTRGQPLVEVETDKATMEVESALGGVLREWLCQVDDEVSVGQPIAVFDVEEAPSGAAAANVERTSSSAIPARPRRRLPVAAGTVCAARWRAGRHVCTESRGAAATAHAAVDQLAVERRPAHGSQTLAGEQADDSALLPADELQCVGDRDAPPGG